MGDRNIALLTELGLFPERSIYKHSAALRLGKATG